MKWIQSAICYDTKIAIFCSPKAVKWDLQVNSEDHTYSNTECKNECDTQYMEAAWGVISPDTFSYCIIIHIELPSKTTLYDNHHL